MPTIVIDNQEIEVPAGTKVIEAAARLGIVIPRFCYHPALGSVGACRVCAVSFHEGPVKGIQMSCMINAQDGMVISTEDDAAVDFRRHVIEWLMMNHPHDCPVCDEGGHCLLQDTTIAGGHGMRRYQGKKRTHRDQDLGPLVQHEMNRCIQCYRCSRYYQEFTGYKDLGVMGIGSRVYFGRSRSGTLESPFSGNLIDLCPTGVYTDKPSRYIGRRWDFERAPSICLHCSLGCNLVACARYRQVVRHEARRNDQVNGHFLCDRGRYGYAYAGLADRPRKPLAKGKPVERDDAIRQAREMLEQTIRRHGAQSLAAVGSPRSSLQTLAALMSCHRRIQCQGPVVAANARAAHSLRAAIRCLDADLAVSLGAVSVAEAVVVIGADPLNEAPMLTLSLRQAQRQGGKIAVIDPRPVEMALAFDHWPVHPLSLGATVRELVRQVDPQWPTVSAHMTGTGTVDGLSPERVRSLARQLVAARRVVVVCGTDWSTAEEIVWSAELARALRKAGTEAKLFGLLNGPNAYAAGMLMDKDLDVGTLLEQIEAGIIRSLLVVENDLWRNYPDRGRLRAALEKLERLILLDYVPSPMVDAADVFIPTQTVYEAGGGYINQEGRLQTAAPALKGGESIARTGGLGHPPRTFGARIPGGEPLPAWEVLFRLMEDAEAGPEALERKLSTALEEIRDDLKLPDEVPEGKRIALEVRQCDLPAPTAAARARDSGRSAGLELLLVDRFLGTEPLASMAPALVRRETAPQAVIHPDDAALLDAGPGDSLQIETPSGSLTLPLALDARMSPGVVVVPRHHDLEWQMLGDTRMTLHRRQLRVSAPDGRQEDE